MGVVNEHSNMYKLVILSCAAALASAAGPPAYGAPAPYHPAPVYKEEKLPPQPFAYEYGVADDYSKNNFKKTETQDAEGKVAGFSPLLSLMEESRPPPTLLTTTMGSLLRLPMREPLSTHLSLRKDMDMLPLSTRLPLYTSLLLPTMPKKTHQYLFINIY